jgi:hypothetical protein
VLYLSKTNRVGNNMATRLAAIDDSSNTTSKGTATLTRASDGAQCQVRVTALTDATDYVKLTIDQHGGATGFTAADAVSFQFARTGDKGTDGGGLANVVDDTTPQLGGTLDTNAKQVRYSKGADVASPAGGNLTLGADGNYFDITGTDAITSIDTLAVGTQVKLHFDAALTLTHHATDLILPGGDNITTAAGDEAEFVEYAAGAWRCTNYQRTSNVVAFNDIKQPASRLITGVVEEATEAEVYAATDGKFLDAGHIESASAPVALTDAATVAVDWDAAINFTLTVTANRAIGNPTNGQPGVWRTIDVQGNDATDRTITFDNQFLGDLPTITDCDSTKWYQLAIYCHSTTHFSVTARVVNKP